MGRTAPWDTQRCNDLRLCGSGLKWKKCTCKEYHDQ